jgi:hypothetical protein
MPVIMATTLPTSVSKLSGTDAKRLWDFVCKFMQDPTQPGISLERVQEAKDDRLWAGRISGNLRAILHKDGDTWTILYAGHHDQAYQWASFRSVERHVKTGALQIVVSPETVIEQIAVRNTESVGLFDGHEDEYLVSLGLPLSWLPTIRKVIDVDVLFEILPSLPEEVQHRFVDLAAGKLVAPPVPIRPEEPLLQSEDNRRRFFVLEDNADLLRMLEAPLATWIAFLHPSQKRLATDSFKGPLKITGSAGTGKTVVALHRARHLARQGRRVLLTTYVSTLCANLERNLALLCSAIELENITVSTVHSQALALLKGAGRRVSPVKSDDIEKLIIQYHYISCPLDVPALQLEWKFVVAAQGITSWEEYRGANRAGRGIPLSVRDRKAVWQVFEPVLAGLNHKKKMDWSHVCRCARELVQSGQAASPFDAVIVDEVQDLGPQELLLLAALAGDGPNHLTVVGDGAQRIYPGGFSLKALGIDVRGRSHILKINYRTTEQIRTFADRLVEDSDDLDGGRDERRGTVSLLRGPHPVLQGFLSRAQQSEFVAERIRSFLAQGLAADEIAVFARIWDLLKPVESQLLSNGIPCRWLNEEGEGTEPAVHLGSMHRAKGLEFKVVFVVEATDSILPLPAALRGLQDAQARADALERERQLLYVSVTRARDEVFLLWSGEASRFLEGVPTMIEAGSERR